MLLKIINKSNKFKRIQKANLKLKNNKNNQINKTNYKKIIKNNKINKILLGLKKKLLFLLKTICKIRNKLFKITQ